MEEWRDGAYRRTLRLPYGHGIVALTPAPDHIACRLSLTDLRDLTVAISRCRRLLDLDADPVAVDDQLRTDPLLAPLVDKAPGRRVPRTVDEAEFAVRAVLGQQVSTAAARTHAARLVTAHGEPVDDPEGGLTHLFPSARGAGRARPRDAGHAPHPPHHPHHAGRRDWPRATSTSASSSDWDEARARLVALPGLRPLDGRGRSRCAPSATPTPSSPPTSASAAPPRSWACPSTPAALTARAAAWRPWRAYAVQYLWATDEPPDQLPARVLTER